MTRFKWFSVVAIAVVVTAAGAVFLSPRANAGGCSLAPATLSQFGLSVQAADAATAAVDQARASQVASGQFHGAQTAEAVLGVVRDPTQPNFGQHLAWLVRLSGVPTLGSRGGARTDAAAVSSPVETSTLCTIVVVDAKTGEFLFGMQDGSAN